jgi:hypothetical protein
MKETTAPTTARSSSRTSAAKSSSRSTAGLLVDLDEALEEHCKTGNNDTSSDDDGSYPVVHVPVFDCEQWQRENERRKWIRKELAKKQEQQHQQALAEASRLLLEQQQQQHHDKTCLTLNLVKPRSKRSLGIGRKAVLARRQAREEEEVVAFDKPLQDALQQHAKKEVLPHVSLTTSPSSKSSSSNPNINNNISHNAAAARRKGPLRLFQRTGNIGTTATPSSLTETARAVLEKERREAWEVKRDFLEHQERERIERKRQFHLQQQREREQAAVTSSSRSSSLDRQNHQHAASKARITGRTQQQDYHRTSTRKGDSNGHHCRNKSASSTTPLLMNKNEDKLEP